MVESKQLINRQVRMQLHTHHYQEVGLCTIRFTQEASQSGRLL